MKAGVKNQAANVLFALNFFIAFLLLFEHLLVIPQWLQPVGRMHTLLLHFPIVLLLLAVVLELFTTKSYDRSGDIVNRFTTGILLAGIISSGLTVIMGIFLSRESGYNAELLSWHKWWGASVFFFSSLMYAFRTTAWYNAVVARVGAVVTVLCLIFAGHFGGALTHGDNFIWEPVLAASETMVPFDQALVFDHVVQPLFKSKCISCHNADKLKGELMLTDSTSILKGGKTGALFIGGDPEKSLLLKRIHLPLSEKKHMPPSGKPQLTIEESELLYQWIKADAPFSVKVASLKETDSLRIAAAGFLTPHETEEVFPFPAVARQKVEKLNSNYRVVSPLAKNSPALVVNVYNRETYSSRTLEELKEVSEQILSLDLGKMPVTDRDMKYIARFTNLRSVNLNFTEVTGAGIQALSELRDLESISLAGTRVNYDDLFEFISSCKRLKTISIWETLVSAEDAARLENQFSYVSFLGAPTDEARALIKLNPPKLKNRSRVFEDSVALELFHPVKDVDIRFTLDGEEPDSIKSTLFKGGTFIRSSTEIKARAFKEGWISSDAAALSLYRSSLKPDTAILVSKMNRVHTAKGATTFFDHELGSFNANSPAWANNWGGVINNDLVLRLGYDTPQRISSFAVNTLIETENFIFPPAAIEVWEGPETNMRLIHRCEPEMPTTYRKPFIKLFECVFPAHYVSELKIVVKPVMKLPAWHKRKGRPALLLIDEILLN